jgi:hypothetical protein
MTETIFGIQFIVTRNGKPITEVIAFENVPIHLHKEHDPTQVWDHQCQVLPMIMRERLRKIDALAEVVPDMHLVGMPLDRERGTPHEKGLGREPLGIPILKVVNRVLLVLVKRLTAYNAKRGDHREGSLDVD